MIKEKHISLALYLQTKCPEKEAIEKLKSYPLSEDEINNEFRFISKKLDITEENLRTLLNDKNKSFKDYKSSYYIIQFFVKLMRFLKIESRLIR